MQINYREYLNSDEWRDIAMRVKIRDGLRCVLCNSGSDLDAHHRTYANLGRERQHLSDLITLCRQCHSNHHMMMQEKRMFGAVKMREASDPVQSTWTLTSPRITRRAKREEMLKNRAEWEAKKLSRKQHKQPTPAQNEKGAKQSQR
jgi:predicted lactoylglutathione lyase